MEDFDHRFIVAVQNKLNRINEEREDEKNGMKIDETHGLKHYLVVLLNVSMALIEYMKEMKLI